MRGVRQTILHDDPEGRVGNCMQAAVATVLGHDLDDVPHFCRYTEQDDSGDPDGLWWWSYLGYLAACGLRVVSVPVDPRNPWLPDDRTCIVSGKSPRGNFSHAVVYDGATGAAWDPHPSDEFLATVTNVEWFELYE